MSSSGVAVAVWSFLPTNCFPHIGKYEEIVMWQEFCDEAHGMFPWRQKIILNAAHAKSDDQKNLGIQL